MPHAAVLFADGFEEIEALAVVDVLRRAGVDATMSGIEGTDSVRGAHDIVVNMDAPMAALGGSLDAVILPGGLPGAENLAASGAVVELVKAVNAGGNLVAAVCAAPIALEAAGVLTGRRYTCYPGFEARISGGTHTGARVEVDGNIITGIGPGAAIEFGLAIAGYLVGQATADNLTAGMQVFTEQPQS